MTLTLGYKPEALVVVLSSGADFTCTLHNTEGDWAAGISIELRFSDTTWTATVTGPDAVFNVDYLDVQEVIDARVKHVRLYYIDGASETCWAVGEVAYV